MRLKILDKEYWYGSCVKYGMLMPLGAHSRCSLDFTINGTPNQAMPFLVSTRGRFLWRECGFRIGFENGEMTFPDDVEVGSGHQDLRGAYLAGMREHFPFRSGRPADNLFQKIIYNTWIELTFHQNEEAIMKYAENILQSGMPPGVLMIDDGWSEYYGNWSFHSGRFTDSEGMLKKLHQLGFDVMLWICPYVSSDTEAYREALKKDILIKTPEGEPFIAKWWNGYSAVLDMTNEKARRWLDDQLQDLIGLGVDGFKFDAGDSIYYRHDNVTAQGVSPDEQSRCWAAFGEKYRFNEYRATFGAGGYGLLQRLCDKEHSWGENGVASLMPDTLLQGITGHPYCCPDMIGGGEYLNFQDRSGELDQELFVRHAEIACLMPAMQFSAAPYRVLEGEYFEAILRSISLREKYLGYIEDCILDVSETGEPMVRYMCYEFPDEPVWHITDQFMVGHKLLVAPVYKKNERSRSVYLPKGRWRRAAGCLKETAESVIESRGELIQSESRPGEPIVFERAED